MSGTANFSGSMFGRGPLTISSVPKSVEEEPNSGNSTRVRKEIIHSNEKVLSQFEALKNKTEECNHQVGTSAGSSSLLPSITVHEGPAKGISILRDTANISDQGLQRDSFMQE